MVSLDEISSYLKKLWGRSLAFKRTLAGMDICVVATGKVYQIHSSEQWQLITELGDGLHMTLEDAEDLEEFAELVWTYLVELRTR